MGQSDIMELLKNKYPNYLSMKDILDAIKINRSNISRALKQLRKRDEIEVKIIKYNGRYSNWHTIYRIKEENHE